MLFPFKCSVSLYYTNLYLFPFQIQLAAAADCEKINVPSLESVRHLILGSVYSNSGQTSKAKMHYLNALQEGEMSDDVHTSAFASYELGMLLCRNYEVSEVLYIACG